MTKTKTETKPVLTDEARDRAMQLMRDYVQSYQNNEDLKKKIANEQESYKKNMAKAEAELLKIGEEYKIDFDKSGNYHLGEGYLHVANPSAIVISKKFDAKAFAKAFPDFFDISKAFKIGPIKKGILIEETRKALKRLGIGLTLTKELQVLVSEKKAES